MDELKYYQDVYNKFWAKQTKVYGYGVYERNLVKLILKSTPKKVFEVGIGTGWPIGTALKEKGVMIDGCDVAESSVALAQKELDNETGIWAGDVTEYAGKNENYDVVYCVRASWYIPDFYSTIRKMMSMTKPGGYIIFDVMDKYSIHCLKSWLVDLKQSYYKLLGLASDNHYGTHFVSIHKMKKFLKKNGLTYHYWSERKLTGSKDIIHTPKVVFCCKKKR